MILSKRVQRPPTCDISYPVHSELAPSFSSPEILASTARTIPPRGHGHKHSLSKPITWLNRSSSSTPSRSISQAPSKPARISEPKVGSSLDQFSLRRSGPLGSGATIVRTPQEALFGPPKVFDLINEEEGMERELEASVHDAEENESAHLPSLRPPSPPLPPLPDVSDTVNGGSLSANLINIPLSDDSDVSHTRLSSSVSPATQHMSSSSSSSTMMAHSRAASRSTPLLPADADVTPPQPPFDALLLSSTPDGSRDPSRLIITLETCTTTYRTSLSTLISRPSHLSRYISSLLSPISETASVYSNASDVYSNGLSSVIRDHLASSGCFPSSSNSIHIFLDRPSAPYTHVLAYLRSLPGNLDCPETLPRAVQLTPMSTARLDSLLELRDEASYLGLTELYALCAHELLRVRPPPAPPLPTSTASHRGMPAQGGKIGSVHSSHMAVEPAQSLQQEARRPGRHPSLKDKGTGTVDANLTSRASGSSSSCDNKDMPLWERSSLKQRRDVKYELGSPPPGWI